MKTILMTVLLACALSGGGCSRSEKQPETAAQATPSPNFQADAERLRQATANAAQERKRAEQLSGSPAPSAAQP